VLIGRPGALAALALAVARAGAAGPAEAVPGAGIDVQHYALTLRPDFATRRIAGTATIDFLSTSDGLQEVVFTANALGVTRASVDGAAVAASRRADGWAFALPRPLRAGQAATLAIAFEGAPARGLVFGEHSVVSSYFTCDWMFCVQDRPGDKATIDLTLVLPKGMTSVGVGARVSVASAAGGLDAHASRERRPYSSYVYGFAAGDFHIASERQANSELVYLSETAQPERLRTLFASTGEMVRFFEEKAGVRLPHGRYVQVHAPGTAAQEAGTFSVIGEDEVSPVLDNPQEDWVIAHELAHQWWGNLVTCADWSEFWLNEGITTFMVAAWKEHRWGRASYDREMDLARQRVDAAARSGISVPLTFPGPFPSLSARRAIAYSKGALFMDRLRRELGEQSFWAALRSFTRAYAGATVVSHDFEQVFEHSSGRDLSALFNQWVY